MIIPNGLRKCFKVAEYIKYLRNEIFINVFIGLQSLEKKAPNPVYDYYIQLYVFLNFYVLFTRNTQNESTKGKIFLSIDKLTLYTILKRLTFWRRNYYYYFF